jgi:hypothetical protein
MAPDIGPNEDPASMFDFVELFQGESGSIDSL